MFRHIHVLPACYPPILPVPPTVFKDCAMCCHVYAIMHVEHPQLFGVRVVHRVMVADSYLSPYTLRVLHVDIIKQIGIYLCFSIWLYSTKLNISCQNASQKHRTLRNLCTIPHSLITFVTITAPWSPVGFQV